MGSIEKRARDERGLVKKIDPARRTSPGRITLHLLNFCIDWKISLRIQPPFIRLRVSDVVAEANERRLYSQATGKLKFSFQLKRLTIHERIVDNRAF